MNPIKNKKNLKETIDEIRSSAYSYIEKYSPSKQQLKTYLFKKLVKKEQKTSSKKEIFNLIVSSAVSGKAEYFKKIGEKNIAPLIISSEVLYILTENSRIFGYN